LSGSEAKQSDCRKACSVNVSPGSTKNLVSLSARFFIPYLTFHFCTADILHLPAAKATARSDLLFQNAHNRLLVICYARLVSLRNVLKK
jgi:hypothetical protein